MNIQLLAYISICNIIVPYPHNQPDATAAITVTPILQMEAKIIILHKAAGEVIAEVEFEPCPAPYPQGGSF